MNDKMLEIILGTALVPIVTALIKAVSEKRKLQIALAQKELDTVKEIEVAQITQNTLRIPRLAEHSFFNNMVGLRDTLMISFELPNRGKEAVFKELLSTILDIYRKHLYNMVCVLDNTNTEGTLTDIVVRDEFLRALRMGVGEYSSFYTTGNYTDDEKKVFAIVIPRFNKWNAHRIRLMEDSVNSTCSSIFFPQPDMKAAIILEKLYATFLDTVQDAEDTLNEINGDLKGLTFKGIEI
jgi:hypothetical protein